MSFDCVLDSFALMEYLRGGPFGERVREYIEHGNGATPSLVIAELSAKFHREGLEGWPEAREFTLPHTPILGLDWSVADKAGDTLKALRSRRKSAGLADAIVLETARSVQAPLLTGDQDLKGAEGVLFLE